MTREEEIVYILDFFIIRREKTLERMANENELEVFVKSSLLGIGRQFCEQVHVARDCNGVNTDMGRRAVRLCQQMLPTCARNLITDTTALTVRNLHHFIVVVVVVVIII